MPIEHDPVSIDLTNDYYWNRVVNVHAQSSHHDTAYIVGNRKGLESLRDAITRALDTASDQLSAQFTNDGEGYEIEIQLYDDVERGDEDSQMIPLAVPYTEDYASEKRDNAIYPYLRNIEG